MARWIHVVLFAAIGALLALGPETPAVRAAGPKPAKGFTLHIDAKLHFPGKPDMIAHHYCKGVSGDLTECLLFESDEPDARLVGVEVIVGPAVYATFSADDKAMWHYHKEEIPKVSATLPDLSADEAAKVVKSIEGGRSPTGVRPGGGLGGDRRPERPQAEAVAQEIRSATKRSEDGSRVS